MTWTVFWKYPVFLDRLGTLQWTRYRTKQIFKRNSLVLDSAEKTICCVGWKLVWVWSSIILRVTYIIQPKEAIFRTLHKKCVLDWISNGTLSLGNLFLSVKYSVSKEFRVDSWTIQRFLGRDNLLLSRCQFRIEICFIPLPEKLSLKPNEKLYHSALQF